MATASTTFAHLDFAVESSRVISAAAQRGGPQSTTRGADRPDRGDPGELFSLMRAMSAGTARLAPQRQQLGGNAAHVVSALLSATTVRSRVAGCRAAQPLAQVWGGLIYSPPRQLSPGGGIGGRFAYDRLP